MTEHYGIEHHDIEHNDTQHNDTQHNDTRHNDTQYIEQIGDLSVNKSCKANLGPMLLPESN